MCLFGIGLIVALLLYNFTDSFVNDRSLLLEESRVNKICSFLQSLENKELETELDIYEFVLWSDPFRIIGSELLGSKIYYCDINLEVRGKCSKKCDVKVIDNQIDFS